MMPKKVQEATEEEDEEDEDEEEEATQIPRRRSTIPAKVQEAKPENNDNNKTDKKDCPYSMPYLCKYLPYWSRRDVQSLIVFWIDR